LTTTLLLSRCGLLACSVNSAGFTVADLHSDSRSRKLELGFTSSSSDELERLLSTMLYV